jgi:endo-beta-N-acetylglucosaminidase D
MRPIPGYDGYFVNADGTTSQQKKKGKAMKYYTVRYKPTNNSTLPTLYIHDNWYVTTDINQAVLFPDDYAEASRRIAWKGIASPEDYTAEIISVTRETHVVVRKR